MLKEIHHAGSVSTLFGSICGAFATISRVELGKAAVEPSGVSRRKSRNSSWGHPQQRPPPKRRAPDRDRGGASSAAEWESQLAFELT